MSLPKLPDAVVLRREKAAELNYDARKTANELTPHLKILKASFELRKQLESFGDTYNFYLDRLAENIEDVNSCELESVFEIMNKALFS